MLQYKQNKKNNKKRAIIITLIILFLIALSVSAFFFTPLKNRFFNNPTNNDAPAGPASTVDYSGPSESDINESQNAKKNADEPATDTSPPSSNSGKKTVPIAVSYADMYNDNLEIRAFISGVIEGTGTCTATATKNGTIITESTSAFIDTSTTQCNPIYINKSRLSAGVWKVIVNFSSPDAQGTSETVEVTI